MEQVAEFKDGALRVTSPLVTLRVSFVPKPCAEEMDQCGRWSETAPELRLIMPGPDSVPGVDPDAAQNAFSAFRATVPPAICAVVEPFGSHQWLLMRLIHEYEYGRDLAETNPVLAYAVANSCELRGTSSSTALKQAVLHCRQRQKELCEWLGFPGTPAMVRLFKRIKPDSASPSFLRRLRIAVNRGGADLMKMLGHRQTINSGILNLLARPEIMELVTPKLLDEVEACAEEGTQTAVADHILNGICLLDQMRQPPRTQPFQSIRQVHAFVEKLDADFVEHMRRVEAIAEARAATDTRNERTAHEPQQAVQRDFWSAMPIQPAKPRKPRAPRAEWPPPPIPGNAQIQPITSLEMLCEEGEAQHNCVKQLRSAVLRKRMPVYVYRLLYPERATFSLMRGAGGVWHLSQIKATENGDVRSATRIVVEAWLQKHSAGPLRS